MACAIISGWITDREEEEYALRLMVDKHHDELFEKFQVNAIADRKIKISDVYVKWKETERQVKKWKRLLATLRDRFQVLTQTKRY